MAAVTRVLEYKNINNYNKDKLKIGLGINLRNKEDDDLPISSSLGKKTSDLIGYSGINFTENLSLNYNFSVDHNLSERIIAYYQQFIMVINLKHLLNI